jgi:aspartate aminotransferase
MSEHRYAARVRSVEMSGIRKLFDAGGPDAINLGIGQPDFDTPDHIKEAAIAAIRAGKTGYTPNAGIPELREAICAKFERENDLTFRPEQILVTAGGSEALHLVMEALVDPGDRVLITDPGFVSYAALATFAGGRPEGVPLDETLHIDVEQAKEQMDGARLFVLNTPSWNTATTGASPSSLTRSTNTLSTKRRMSAQPTLATTSSPSTPQARHTP